VGVEERQHVGELTVSPDEPSWLHRQVRQVEALQRRELTVPKLIKPLRRSKVFEPVHAQVEQAICACEIARALRDENLATVTRRRNTRSAMHIDPDVPLVGDDRLAGMQSNPHSNRCVGKGIACSGCRCECVGRLRERDEERVSLRLHLDATVACERLAQEAPVLRQQVGVVVAKFQ
jgi:hypothetical protein